MKKDEIKNEMKSRIDENEKSIVVYITPRNTVAWRSLQMSSADIVAVLNKVIFDNLRAISNDNEMVKMEKIDGEGKDPDDIIDSYFKTI